MSAAAGIEAAYGNGLGVVATDFDGDGLQDVFVANDKTMNQLWLNRGDLEFKDEALLWGCAMDNHGIAKAGMGVASGDVDDDGDADLLVVNIEGETDSYYRNEKRYFVDATASVGLGTTSRRYTRFGVALADFDNDGRLDLYEANGRVTYSPEPEARDVYAEPNVLYRGVADGRFDTVGEMAGTHTSRGLAFGDVDNDGGIDMLVVNRDAAPYLLMNGVADRGNWVRLRVLDRSGRDAYGARITARFTGSTKTRYVQPAGSYLASNEPLVHIGLGAAELIEQVEVRWPTGEMQSFGTLQGGQTHTLRPANQ